MNIDKSWNEFQEEQNVKTKMFFFNIFNKFKGSNEKNELKEFKKLVNFLGKSWNVSRTVPVEEFDDFAKHLYDELKNIKKGEYNFFKNAWTFKNKKHAHSYESKICFCINPKKYYLIYDSNNCNGLKEILQLKKKVGLKNFNKFAEEFINKEKPKTEEEYFKWDYKLWAGIIK